MALETGSHIDDLVATNPASSDPLHQIDEHLRLIKAVIKATLPGADRALLDSVGKLLLANIPNLPASRTTSGAFTTARIPNLPTSKITSGSFSTARIPSLAASKITSGAFTDARIPNLNASKTTAGRFDVDRVAWTGSQTDYDALTPDSDTLYLITS